jgi:preprotein translocase subunit SecD
MRRQVLTPLIGILVVAFGLLALSIANGNSTALGIDLDGGVEVGLVPVEDTDIEGAELDDALDTSLEILRNRVDGLGVAEPDITRQGDRIVVQLPGVEDQERAIEIVGATAELRFRPVCAELGPAPTGIDPIGDGDDVDPDDVDGDGVRDQPFGISPDDADPLVGEGEKPLGCISSEIDPTSAFSLPSTTREDDEADRVVILPEIEDGVVVNRYLLGRTFCFSEDQLGIVDEERTGECRLLTGSALEGADSTIRGIDWVVLPTFNSGVEGIGLFNAAAQECFNGTAACPTGRLAMVLDGTVISAPSVNTGFFSRDEVQISGAFDEDRAKDVALKLRYGALPIEFEDPADPDSQSTVNNVSATLGRDSLKAGIIAGLIGFGLVGLFMLAYYRLLGLAAILSLGISGTLTWVILAWMSTTQGLALTLAGVVGLIVSIGTSLDSNVVYFEHMKEDVLNGRTVRSSVDRSFPVAFKTIFFANMTALIGAAILWWLTIGSVRGFAFVLGLASILDLVATYFFLRPFVKLVSRSSRVMGSPGWFGIPPAPPEPEPTDEESAVPS